jgi:hypothetical protein
LSPQEFGILSNYTGKVDSARLREGVEKLQGRYGELGFSNLIVNGQNIFETYNFNFSGQNLAVSGTKSVTSINVAGDIVYQGLVTSIILNNYNAAPLPAGMFNTAISTDPSVTQYLAYDTTTGLLSFRGQMSPVGFRGHRFRYPDQGGREYLRGFRGQRCGQHRCRGKFQRFCGLSVMHGVVFAEVELLVFRRGQSSRSGFQRRAAVFGFDFGDLRLGELRGRA